MIGNLFPVTEDRKRKLLIGPVLFRASRGTVTNRRHLISPLNKRLVIAAQLRHMLIAEESAEVAQKYEDQPLAGRTPDFAQSPFTAGRNRQRDIGRRRSDWWHTATRFILGHRALQVITGGQRLPA